MSAEAHLVHAWDGWCNYGIGENAKIKYMIPKEGSDLWVDTMVVTSASENKEAAHKFINYVLSADIGKWVVENILYKVPNKAAMDAIDPKLIETYPEHRHRACRSPEIRAAARSGTGPESLHQGRV